MCTTIYYCALQCTIVYYCVLLYTAVYYCVLLCTTVYYCELLCTTVYYCVLLCTAVCGSAAANVVYVFLVTPLLRFANPGAGGLEPSPRSQAGND